MDVVLSIFQQLGANSSLLTQFLITAVIFVLAKVLFFDHLQNVLDSREDKTTKLEGNAEKQFEEVNKLSNAYKEKIQAANKEAKGKFDSAKGEISKTLEASYKAEESEIDTYVEASRKEVEKELHVKKEQIMNDAEQLATSLVQKITKG